MRAGWCDTLSLEENRRDGRGRREIRRFQRIADFGGVVFGKFVAQLRGVVAVRVQKFQGKLLLQNQINCLRRVVGFDQLMQDFGA